DRDDEIAGTEAGSVRRATGNDRRDDRAGTVVLIRGGLDPEERGAADVDRLGAVAALDLLDDRHGLVDRDRIALVGGRIRDVVPDRGGRVASVHLAGRIHERPTRIPGAHRRVRLDQAAQVLASTLLVAHDDRTA